MLFIKYCQGCSKGVKMLLRTDLDPWDCATCKELTRTGEFYERKFYCQKCFSAGDVEEAISNDIIGLVDELQGIANA